MTWFDQWNPSWSWFQHIPTLFSHTWSLAVSFIINLIVSSILLVQKCQMSPYDTLKIVDIDQNLFPISWTVSMLLIIIQTQPHYITFPYPFQFVPKKFLHEMNLCFRFYIRCDCILNFPRIEVLNTVMLYFDIFLQCTCTNVKESIVAFRALYAFSISPELVSTNPSLWLFITSTTIASIW